MSSLKPLLESRASWERRQAELDRLAVEGLHQAETDTFRAFVERAEVVELWAPIPGFSGYYVSTFGGVASTKRGRLRRLSPAVNTYGYFAVTLTHDDGTRHAKPIHRIVLETFAGHPESAGNSVRHLNGVATDNRLWNLAWGTATNNMLDRRIQGTWPRGETTGGRTKLNASDVLEIRAARDLGQSYGQIAKRFGVTRSCVYKITKGHTWRHL